MAIVVLGSGRSGTSLVTGMLRLSGVYLGEEKEVRYADHTNEKGSWEHAYLNVINDRLLRTLGGSFADPPALQPGWEDDPALEPIYSDARALLDKTFGGRDLWGWKMPRAVFTLPFWRRVMPEIKVVLCLRNPVDFVASVCLYYDWQSQYALALWLQYNITMLENTIPSERILVCYEDFFPDYRVAYFPVLDFLGLPRPGVGSDTDVALADFCEPGLKHHSSTVVDLLEDDSISYSVKQLYIELLTGPPDASDVPLLPRLSADLPILRMAIHGAAAANECVRLQAEAANLRAERDQLQADAANLRAERDQLQADIAHHRSVLASRTHRIADRVCSVLIALGKAKSAITPNG